MIKWQTVAVGNVHLPDVPSHLVRIGGLLSLGACTLMAMSVSASDAGSAAQARTLEEILVTAQRRTESAVEVPITVTAVSGRELQEANVNSLMSLPKVTPGLRFDQQGAYTQPTIRGIGTSVVQTGSGSNVGIYVDGYYMPTSLSADLQLMNIENIQTLKGPQGTLFGRNTPGGAILIQTAEPSTETRAILEAGYERFHTQRYQGYFTTGLSERLAVSLEGRFSKGDGFVRNLYDGSLASGGGFAPGASRNDPGAFENWGVRASLKFDLNDRVDFLLRYSHSDTDDPTAVVVGTYRDRNGLVHSAGDAIPGTVFGFKRGDTANNAAISFRNRTDTVQLTGNFDLGFAQLTSYSQYREEEIDQIVDSDASSAAAFALDLPEQSRIVSQEFLLNSTGEGRLQYTTGLFLYRQTIDAGVLMPDVSGYVFPFSATGVDIRTYAAFADVTYEITDNLFLTGGLRYSRDEIKKPYYQTLPGVPGAYTYQSDFSDDEVTPRVVLRYMPTENSSVYISYTEGYKSAIYDPRATSGNDFLEPEQIKAWEVGYKYAGDTFSASIAPFYYQYKDLQNAYYEVGESILSNAAESTIKGVEGELRIRLGHSLELSAAATYLDAEFDEYLNAGYFEPRLNAAGRFEGYSTNSVDASGFRMHRSPKYSGSLGARYTTDVFDGELALSGNLYFTSSFYFDPANQFKQDAYQVLAARVQWTDPSGRYTVALYGDNLADDKYYTQVNPVLFGTGVIWGTPRTWGASLRVEL